MIQKLQSKPIKKGMPVIEVELYKACTTIQISNATEHYDEDFIQMYFESHRKSGGGTVTHVEMLGNGEATVTFQDPKGSYHAFCFYCNIPCSSMPCSPMSCNTMSCSSNVMYLQITGYGKILYMCSLHTAVVVTPPLTPISHCNNYIHYL